VNKQKSGVMHIRAHSEAVIGEYPTV